MKRKKKSGDAAATEMNLTPMIDVTFLLLVFFLVGTKFKEPEGKLNAFLPKDKGPPDINKVVIEPVEEIVVQVMMKPGRQYATYKLGEHEFLTIPELEQQLMSMYDPTKEQKDQPVTIDPSPTASYQDVLHVLNSCVKVGFENISFAAAIPEGKQVAGEARAAF